ncbi:MAG: adenylate kinase [Alteromonadales bacterium]|nr:adenylate kinase [Alteromonadales bacterium]
MRLILLGPPGAGKGTQAANIVNKFNLPHISTGDIFRANIKQGTELGKKAKGFIDNGELVPDSLTVELIEDRLQKDDTQDGFMLDGFPRNIYQAEALDEVLNNMGKTLDYVINIVVDPSVLVGRAVGRRICKECGATYHVEFNAPKAENVCDKCSGELYQRSDDNEETVSNRISVYTNETAPLINYYEKAGKIVSIDGLQEIEKVFSDIDKVLGE